MTCHKFLINLDPCNVTYGHFQVIIFRKKPSQGVVSGSSYSPKISGSSSLKGYFPHSGRSSPKISGSSCLNRFFSCSGTSSLKISGSSPPKISGSSSSLKISGSSPPKISGSSSSLKISGCSSPKIDEVKLLGVVINNNLKWDKNTSFLVKQDEVF